MIHYKTFIKNNLILYIIINRILFRYLNNYLNEFNVALIIN